MSGGEGDGPEQYGEVDGPSVTASYVSSAEVLGREARALADLELADPGRRRRFALRHGGAAVLVVVVLGLLVATGHGTVAGGLRATAVMLGALALLTLMDLALTRRRLRRVHLARATAGCPPGTLVRGVYTPQTMTFVLPEHRITLALATVASATWQDRLLLVRQHSGALWVVPDELMGTAGHTMLRTALGERFVTA